MTVDNTSPHTTPARNLASFSAAATGYDRGRGLVWQVAWLAVSTAVAMKWWCPNRVRVAILRAFGASVGTGCVIRHRVRVHWPWKLTVGDHSWIGEGTWIINPEPVTVGSHVCLSQDVVLCAGGHDPDSPTFALNSAPIVIEDGAWVALRATVLRGTTVGANAVVGACALVTSDVPAGQRLLAPRATYRT